MDAMLTQRHADSDADILACFGLLRQLRPALQSAQDMLAVVRKQQQQGYRLLVRWRGNEPLALAGYREMDNLIHGHFIYVDDLVTNAADRGHGHGEQLLAGLRAICAERQCARLVLDTAVANQGAQRFYSRIGMQNLGLHYIHKI